MQKRTTRLFEMTSARSSAERLVAEVGRSEIAVAEKADSGEAAGSEKGNPCIAAAVVGLGDPAAVLEQESLYTVAAAERSGILWVGARSHLVAAVAGLPAKRKAVHIGEGLAWHCWLLPDRSWNWNTY